MKRTIQVEWIEKGFTFVEILVVLAVTGLVTAGMFNFMISQTRSYSIQDEMQESDQNARVTLELLAQELQKATSIIPNPMKKIKDGQDVDDNIRIAYTEADGSVVDRIYRLKGDSKYTDDDGKSWRIGYRLGDQDSKYTGSDEDAGSIGYFVTQDIFNEDGNLNGDGIQDIPVFQYDDRDNPGIVRVTIVTRTRHKDPRYGKNNNYRQIVLSRRVQLRNM
jgi:prepilin-type N-terminal cleavage/methylation domain-containing protein